MTIQLSPMDYYFYRRSLYTIQFVFEFEGYLPKQKISQGLLRVLQVCPAAGSRIKILSDRRIDIETGHQIPLRIRELIHEGSIHENVENFLDSVVNSEGEPLVRFLVTHTPQRTFVGVSFSHLLGDGFSFFQFMMALSNVIKDRPQFPDFCNDRSLLKAPALSTPPSLFESTGYVCPRPPPPLSVKVKNIFYTFEEITFLKQKFSFTETSLSANDLIMADLVRRFHHDIPLHEGSFLIRCPVDYRAIYGLPRNYFGNAVRDAVACFQPEEIQDLSLGEIALRIKHSIQFVDRPSVHRSLEALDQLRQQHGIDIFESVGCPGLLVSNLSKFPIHLIDLGVGAPIQLHHGSLNPRMALILPVPKGLKVTLKQPLSVPS